MFLGPPGTAVTGVDEADAPPDIPEEPVEPTDEATDEVGAPDATVPVFDDDVYGLRCYSEEIISNSYDDAEDAYAYESVEAAARAWWVTDSPGWIDRGQLTAATPTPVSESAAMTISFADAADNPQVVLAVSEFGAGWLVGEARMCSAATLADES